MKDSSNLNEEQILNIINKYNNLMAEAIISPNCTDPNICHGDCCYIQIDIPKVLAEYYIKQKIATKQYFKRGNVFNFVINVREKDSKCIFFDDKLNGCKLHSLRMKPPQCWIYPTGFHQSLNSNTKQNESNSFEILNMDIDKISGNKCKRIGGWKIIDEKKISEARKLLDEYLKYSLDEFKQDHTDQEVLKRIENLRDYLKDVTPSLIVGVIDCCGTFKPLYAEGKTLVLKKVCKKFCLSNVKENELEVYLNCSKMCNSMIDFIINACKKNILNLINRKSDVTIFLFNQFDLT